MRAPRPDHPAGRAAQGQGHAAPRRSRRARRAGAEIAELDVCPVEELAPGEVKIVHAGLVSVGVYNLDGRYCAIEDRCSHDDGPLCEGDFDLETGVVTCPRHGANFDICSGRALTLPAYEPVKTFPVRVDDGMIKVEI